MKEVLTWLRDYSLPVVALIALGSAALFVLKLVVERAIKIGFDRYAKTVELLLARRSAFEDMVLRERFALVSALSVRLERVMTNLDRLRNGRDVEPGFLNDAEIVPLTSILEDLAVNRLVLTDSFYEVFVALAMVAQAASEATETQQWKELTEEWGRLREQLRSAAEKEFKLSEIRM